jgi:cytochrome P450
MEGFVATIVAAIDEHTAGWKSGQTLEIAHEMKTLGQKVMLKALLGDDANRETGALQKAVRARRSYYEHLLGSSLPFPEYHPVPVSFRYASAIRLLDQTIYQAIQSRRASGAQSNDLLSEFIRASYDDGTTMTDKQIRDEALTFMDTGYETLSSALAWAWYLLAQQPQIQSKLSTELQENLENGPVTANDLPRLGYAEMVLNETLRLFPPTWMFVRVAQKEDKLPSGAVIPAKAKLFLSQYLAHRNPSYFPNPEHFDPERFGEAQESSRPKFAYFPFGGGAHICIGEPFARLECILVLATLGRRFNFELVTGQKIVPDPNLNLRPKHGIRLRLKEATRQSESR